MTGCAKELKVTPAENLKVEYGERNWIIQNYTNVKKCDENVKVDKVRLDAKKTWRTGNHCYISQ